ncbi:MAG: hypothetical protein ACUZ77_07845 [Candidatus Brocadiales bacterium]
MKEGWKTTEFWIGMFGVILVFLNDQLGLGFETNTVIGAVTIIVGYIASRTVLKNGAKTNDEKGKIAA